MRKEAPTITQILSYKDIYGESLSINRLELVKSIPKKALIAEIAALNYRLKSSTESRFKFDIQSQFNELKFLCGKNEDFYKQMEKRVAKAAFKYSTR